MISEKAKFVTAMLRKMKNAPKAEAVPDYAKRRAAAEANHARQKKAEGVLFEELDVNGVEVVCAIPDGPLGEGVLYYIHGGGFNGGSAHSSMAYASHLARAFGTRVYTVSYRLAPEDPWPAAPEDCLAVYRGLLERHPGEKIALIGGSAGGNLCLVTALMAREQRLAMPAALALFSPVGDQTDTLPSRKLNADRDCSLSGELDREFQETYARNADVWDPHLSPARADLSELPPMLIVVDQDEVLFDDAVLLDAHARKAGVRSKLIVTEGLFHDFPSVGPELPEAAQILEEVGNLLHSCGIIQV